MTRWARLPNLLALMSLGILLLGVVPDQPAPALEGVTLQGRRWSLSAQRGRVVVVDFWASWCEPCRAAMPFLNGLARRYEARGLTVVGVSVDDEFERCQGFVRAVRPTFTIVHDAGQAAVARWEPDAMPSTYVIDRRGRVRAVFSGFTPESEAPMERAVTRALDAP